MVLANFVFLTNTAIKMAMFINLSTLTNTSDFFYQLLFIHNYHRITLIFYGINSSGRNSFMGLDQGVNSCLSLYYNMPVLSFWLS